MKHLLVAFDDTNPVRLSAVERKYLLFAAEGSVTSFHALDLKAMLKQLKGIQEVDFCLFMTKISTQAMSSSLNQISPDDNFVYRKVKKVVAQVNLWAIPHYPLQDALLPELVQLCHEAQNREKQGQSSEEASNQKNRMPFLAFNWGLLGKMFQLIKESYVIPGKQDFFYLGTKTFGLNLIVRIMFLLKGVKSGDLPLDRAIISTLWYQLQDAFFTIYGQTYMRFLGKMSTLLTVGRTRLGEPIFVYLQLSFFEFFNRLILGPLGENPLVYTWKGIALIFVNNLQGMLSAGLLNPSFGRMREVGLIKNSTMMHLYQLGSLAMYFGLFANFGYQTFYTILTTSLMLFSWSIFFGISFFFRPLKCQLLADQIIYEKIQQYFVTSQVRS